MLFCYTVLNTAVQKYLLFEYISNQSRTMDDPCMWQLSEKIGKGSFGEVFKG